MLPTNSTKRKVIATNMLWRHKWHSKNKGKKLSKAAIYKVFLLHKMMHATCEQKVFALFLHRRTKIQPKFRKALMTSIGKFYSTEIYVWKLNWGNWSSRSTTSVRNEKQERERERKLLCFKVLVAVTEFYL